MSQSTRPHEIVDVGIARALFAEYFGAPEAPAPVDAIASARGHVRAALRELSALNVTINAYACDDDFGQPNRCTAAMDELALALADLGAAS